MKGYLVWSFQPQQGIKGTPYLGKIVDETGNHWKLRVGRKVYTAHKGACSTVPFKDKKETRSAEYAKKVREVAHVKDFDDEQRSPKVETPKRDTAPRKKKPAGTGLQRPGNGKDKSPSRSVRRAPSKKGQVRTGGSASRFAKKRVG